MKKWIVGIDEVGKGSTRGARGCCGRRTAAGIRLKNDEIGELRDSKKLSAAQREQWAAYFKNHRDIQVVLARVYPRGIETHNISGAANLAAMRAFGRLVAARGLSAKNCNVYLDGGLFLKSKKEQAKSAAGIGATTVVRGDEKITAVKIASIIAKVHRDRFMRKLAKHYARYGFDVHKGYGTALHRGDRRGRPDRAAPVDFPGPERMIDGIIPWEAYQSNIIPKEKLAAGGRIWR